MLDHLKTKAIQAHSWTSFSPEKRGEQLINEFTEELKNDLSALTRLGATESQLSNYRAKFEMLLSSWIGAKGRCMSSMITGGSNFPVRRAQKANNAEHNRYTDFSEWRKKVVKAYERMNKKDKIAAAGGELEVAKAKLASLEALQDWYKQINAGYRSYKKDRGSIEKLNLDERQKVMIRTFIPEYSWIQAPIAPYQLTNNNATIKNTRDRIQELENREIVAAAADKDLNFEGGRVEVNQGADRIQIFHDQKPAPEKIKELKSSGFNWSPFNKCWQRKITDNAIRSTERVTGVKIK